MALMSASYSRRCPALTWFAFRIADRALTDLVGGQVQGIHPDKALSGLFTVLKLNAADPTRHKTALGKTMTAQQIHSRANPVENPGAMTVAQIDQALRDFVLQDSAHLRRDAQTASQDISEPERRHRRFQSSFVRWRVPL
jgi:hypothetical protein